MQRLQDRGRLGFLLSRRWLGLLAFVIVFAIACLQLGRWQLHRLESRQRNNALITSNASSRPVPPGRVLSVGRPIAAAQQYTRVTATGRYDTAHQLLARNHTLDGVVGFWVLVPLRPDGGGPALLVNRGWVAAGQRATEVPRVPGPPAGEVTVIGRVRQAEPPSTNTAPPAGQVSRVAATTISRIIGYPLYDGYVDLTRETPPTAGHPRLLPSPETSEGPHLAYAFQWFLFGLMALGGFVQLARREVSDNAATATAEPCPAPASPSAAQPPVVSVRVDQ